MQVKQRFPAAGTSSLSKTAHSWCCQGRQAIKVHFLEIPRVNTCRSSSLGAVETLRKCLVETKIKIENDF